MDTIQLQYFQVLGLKQSSPLLFVGLTTVFFALLYAFNMVSICQFMGIGVEYGVLTFYAFTLLSFVPCFPGHDSRMYFFQVMKLIIFPGNKISFPEIMVADALCSLSKIFKDLGITMVILYSGVYGGTEILTYHNQAMILVALLASIPFAIRIRQCNVQLTGASDMQAKIPITLNIIKYFTSFPPIWLAALSSMGYFHPYLSTVTVIMATINSTYSYAWDIIMDWGLFTFYSSPTSTTPSMKIRIFPPTSTFSFPIHLIISCLNLLLRFSWAASRLPLFAALPPSQLVLLLEVAEIFRRSVWFIFRIEWEMVNTELKKQAQLNNAEHCEVALIEKT